MNQVSRCVNCRFYQPSGSVARPGREEKVEAGECRRYPAKLDGLTGSWAGWGVWPRVFPNNWCGEHMSIDTV